MTPEKDSRIIIIGAGPSGLLTAKFLAERGFTKVIVLEKLGRIGGKTKSITVNGRAYDLGANYVTPAYKKILRLARDIGAKLYSERRFIAMDVPDDAEQPAKFSSIFQASRIDDSTGKLIPMSTFTWAMLRFTYIRWRLSSFIDKPTFSGVEDFDNGALCDTLDDWLIANDLTALRRVLELPTTLMGYGEITTTPAIYPLKFMTLRTFIPMVLKEVPFIGALIAWPKRFLHGYQRFFETLAFDLDVRTSVDITDIERTNTGVVVRFNHTEQDLDLTASRQRELRADYLIMACPLNLEVSENLLHLTDTERDWLRGVDVNSYCMSTFNVEFAANSLGQNAPLAAVYPVPKLDGRNKPAGVAKQWDSSGLVQVYTSTLNVSQDHPTPGEAPEVEAAVVAEAEVVLKQMGATIKPDELVLRTFNRWPYFQHVNSDTMKAGWYTKLEAQQGQNRTYYVGGPTNFDLIEPIAEYANHLVEHYFVGR